MIQNDTTGNTPEKLAAASAERLLGLDHEATGYNEAAEPLGLEVIEFVLQGQLSLHFRVQLAEKLQARGDLFCGQYDPEFGGRFDYVARVLRLGRLPQRSNAVFNEMLRLTADRPREGDYV